MRAANENLPALSQAEWNAVAIALRDPDRHVHTASRSAAGRFFDRVYTAFTGNSPATSLADPRLETLRRFVVGQRRNHADERSVSEMLAQGFNRAQVQAISLIAA